jgi:DeoR/GlpR family transcriptional regulator of sugar metabolism
MDTPNKRVEFIPAKRRAMILDHLRLNGAASVQELVDAIGGSGSTIRRDLEHLVEGGYLERTHGGALLLQPHRATFERETSINAQLRHPEKEAIGAEAALRLNPRDSVIFDSSSTVVEAVKAATKRDIPLTIVTNSLEIADIGATVPGWKVIVPGGTIRTGSKTLIGQPGEGFLQTIHADVLMTGTFAIMGGVLSDASIEIAQMKRAMLRSARRTILLADSSKFTEHAFSAFSDLSAIDELITDEGATSTHIDSVKSFNVKVTVVSIVRT